MMQSVGLRGTFSPPAWCRRPGARGWGLHAHTHTHAHIHTLLPPGGRWKELVDGEEDQPLPGSHRGATAPVCVRVCWGADRGWTTTDNINKVIICRFIYKVRDETGHISDLIASSLLRKCCASDVQDVGLKQP